jgi:hypothetical protein
MGLESSQEERGSEAERCDAVTVGSVDSFNESAKPEPAKLVAHAGGSDGVGVEAEKTGQAELEVSIVEFPGMEIEGGEGSEESLSAHLSEAERRDTLDSDGQRALELGEGILADVAVAVAGFDVE